MLMRPQEIDIRRIEALGGAHRHAEVGRRP